MLQAPRIVRWTLPALLLMLVVGGLAIVSASKRDTKTPGTSARTTTTPVKGKKKRKKARRVIVRTGDTASSIARKAKLTELELLELNPNVDPRLLRPGQKLKISP